MKRHVTLIIAAATFIAGAAGPAGAETPGKFKMEDGRQVTYTLHLPDGFKKGKPYPVLVGPVDVNARENPRYFWQHNPTSYSWIIVESPTFFMGDGVEATGALLDDLANKYKVEGGRFHFIGWSQNASEVFRVGAVLSKRVRSITALPGHPNEQGASTMMRLKDTKVLIVVGERDTVWLRAARKTHKKMQKSGIDCTLEVVPRGGHVLSGMIGRPLFKRLNSLREREPEPRQKD